MELSSSGTPKCQGDQLPLPLIGGEMFSEPKIVQAPIPIDRKLLEFIRRLDKRGILVRKSDLYLPLFDSQDEETIRPAERKHEDSGIRVESLSFMDNQPFLIDEEAKECESWDWTLDDIFWLHEKLLKNSLKVFRKGIGNKNNREILEWIFEPDLIADSSETGHKPIYTKDVPWTFVFCCRLEGADPEVIRDEIRSRIQRV